MYGGWDASNIGGYEGGWDASNIGGYEGGYEGGWNPATYLQGDAIKDLPLTTYHTKAGHPYLDIRAWAEAKKPKVAERDEMLTQIYMSAKMMKYHPQITKDLKKSYGLLASAAMRALSKEKKFILKKTLAPYNQAKRSLAAAVAAEKAKLGYVPRKGLQGRIDYWNQLYDLPMNDTRALLALNGINNTVAKDRFKLPDNSVWSAADYPAYKAALKAKAQARKDLIARMTEAERDTYKKRAKMLSAARKLMVGYRKDQRELDKKASNLKWGKMTMHSFEPEFARALEKAKATEPDKFADIQPSDLIAYLRNPKASFFGSYTSGIDGLAKRAIAAPKTYVDAPLDSRAAVDWDEEAAAPAANTQ